MRAPQDLPSIGGGGEVGSRTWFGGVLLRGSRWEREKGEKEVEGSNDSNVLFNSYNV